MLEQYFGMKSRHPEAILLSRVGDFYEAYGEDAETVARALSIALTSKEAGAGKRVAMAGVPHHALSGYLARLVAQRWIVALAEQLETPIQNKLVKRDVVRVVTPGTLIEDQLLDGKQNNYLAAVTTLGETIALAHADVSTGHCAVTVFSGESSYEELIAELGRIGPAEVIADVASDMRAAMRGAVETLGARLTAPPLSAVDERERAPLPGFSLDESLAMHRSLDALRTFVQKTGVTTSEALSAVDFYREQTFLALDAQTRKNLELTKPLGANPKATLSATLDKCATSMGSRMLARWILAPLLDPVVITGRADSIAALLRAGGKRGALQEILSGCFDLERIAQKIRFKRANPRDLASLRRTLELLQPLRESLPSGLQRYSRQIVDLADVLRDLHYCLAEEPPASIGEGGAIRPESHADLSECMALRSDARGKLSELEERERTRTGIKSLKIKYAGPFGYSIEVTKNNLINVPSDYVRRQTLANGERFVTAELKELEVAISSAQSRRLRLEETLFAELLERIHARVDDLQLTARALAEVDVLCSLAQCAAERGYVRPTFVDGSSFAIRNGRHPVMEELLKCGFVPNDLNIGTGKQRFLLLTGPNMGGKSTYLRQAALLVIMSQIGSFVPAESATLGIVDRIFTRIGAGDDLASGHSTFYVEMSETAAILRRCTASSLLLIDEVGRGTGTIDGLAIAQAICEFLLGLEQAAPAVLFATHFHELIALAQRWPCVANFHITAVENTAKSGAPIFSHRVLPGSSSRSFGIEVARMAGLPQPVLARAQEIANALEGRPTLEAQVPLKTKLGTAHAPDRQLFFDL